MRLHTVVECLAGCGVLGEGHTGDPVQGRQVRPDWIRADELDSLSKKHAETHPTRISTDPVRETA